MVWTYAGDESDISAVCLVAEDVYAVLLYSHNSRSSEEMSLSSAAGICEELSQKRRDVIPKGGSTFGREARAPRFKS